MSKKRAWDDEWEHKEIIGERAQPVTDMSRGALHVTHRPGKKVAGTVVVHFDYSPLGNQLMKHIGATFTTDRGWSFREELLPLVLEELEQIPVRAPAWAGEWPARLADDDAKQIKIAYRYDSFPKTPEAAQRWIELRKQARSAKDA